VTDTKGKNNVTLLMHIWEAFNRNDLEAVNKMVSEDIVYRVSGRGPVSGIYTGRLAFMKVLEKVKELSGGTITVRPIVTLADDAHVFVLARATGRRGGKVLDIEHRYLYRFSNGKLVEGRTMPVDLYEFDEFWK
jgi:ketosteroid isomerase-like protein